MRQLPCWCFLYYFPSVSLFFSEIKQNISEMPISRSSAGVPAAATTAAVTLIPVHMRGLALAKLLVLHVRAGTLLQAELRKFFPAAMRSLPFAASLDEGEELFLGHLHLAEALCALLLHAAA